MCVCVCISLYLPFSLTLLFEAGPWQLALRFFVCLKLWGIGSKLVSLNVCCGCVVHACPGLHLKCVCVRCICLCVAEQQGPGCHSAEQWQSWGSCMARQCCWKQRGDLEESVSAFSVKASHYISFCIVHLCQGRHFRRKHPRSGCAWNFSSSVFLLSSFLKFSKVFFCLTHVCLSLLPPRYWRACRHAD